MSPPETKYLLDNAADEPLWLEPEHLSHPAEGVARSLESVTTGSWTSGWGFRLTMLRYHRLVFRVALQFLHDRAEAEDVCQECFLRYWQHQQQVRQSKEWLLQVTRNLCISRLRRHGRVSYCENETVEAVAQYELNGAEHMQELPEQRLQQEQRATSLREAVARLPEPQRSLVVLFDLEGLDGAACARILELNPSQVKVYLHRARKRLRSQLEHCL